MKSLMLMQYQYSKLFFKEMLLFIQILLLIIVGYTASGSFLFTCQLNDAADSVYGSQLVYFDVYSRIIEIIEGFAGFEENESIKLNQQINSAVMQFDEVKGIGEIGQIVYIDAQGYPNSAVVYNTALIENTNVPMLYGDWKNLLVKAQNIPMIVSKDNCYGLKYGDTFHKKLLYFENEDLDVCFEVVGVIANDAELPRILEGGTEAPATSFILEKNLTDDIFIFHSDFLGGYQYDIRASKLIFLNDLSADEFIRKYENDILPYGRLAALDQMKQEQWRRSVLEHKEEIIILFSIFVLLIFSIVGYVFLTLKSKQVQNGILMLCGMSKQKLKRVHFTANFAVYFGAYIAAIPICVKTYPNYDILVMYFALVSVVLLLLLTFACILSNRLISKMELSSILKGGKNE